jgi:AcrR family transcriptional regulator
MSRDAVADQAGGTWVRTVACRSEIFFRPLEPDEGWTGRREAVPAMQRARMLDAITHVAASKGYVNVTVSAVVAVAGVSRRTFYEQFHDREDCFLAAYAAGADVLIDDMVTASLATGESAGWEDILEAAADAYVGTLAANPEFARTFLVDISGAGPKAVELRRRVYQRFADQYQLLSRLGARQDGLGEVPEIYLHGLVGSTAELIQQHLLANDPESLPELTPVIVRFIRAVFRGVALEPAGS